MADYVILYWQDIPSMVQAREGRATHKVQLGQRFQGLIDIVAMRKGLAGTDAYLAAWRRSKSQRREGSPEAVAKSVSEELEADFDTIKAAALEGV